MNKNTAGLRCHDADACAMGQRPCPTPKACGCEASDPRDDRIAELEDLESNLMILLALEQAECRDLRGQLAALQAPVAVAVPDEDLQDLVSKSLRRAWQLGQTYWQQGDSEYVSQHKKADATQAKFQELVEETRSALAAAPAQEHATQLAGQGQDGQTPWLPYLSDCADGVRGHYAIARRNPSGYREVWNLRSHQWAAASDEVLTLEEALAILRKLEMPTATAAPIQAQEDARDALVEHVVSAARNAVDASFEVMDDFTIEGHLVAALSLALDELDAARAAQGGRDEL